MIGIHRDYVYSVGKNIQHNIKESREDKPARLQLAGYLPTLRVCDCSCHTACVRIP